LLHYYPRHVSSINMPIFRRKDCIHTASGIFALCKRLRSTLCTAASKPDTQPSAPHYTDNLETKHQNTTDSNNLYNTLELLIMGIMVPETCWASNKICNKKTHLLHIVGILFPRTKKNCAPSWLYLQEQVTCISH
jgi:hypothetical protein